MEPLIKILSFAFAFLGPALAIESLATTCKPAPAKNGVTHYIVGYGGFMNNTFLHRFYPNTSNNLYPVQVMGWQRVWNSKRVSIGYTFTYLGVKKDSSSSFNGGIFSLTNGAAGLATMDARESFYCREEVDPKILRLVSSKSNSSTTLPAGQYWILVNKPEYTGTPSHQYPIVQSDVDILLEGCMEIEGRFNLTGFADQCVTTTHAWSMHWVNDRIQPRKVAWYDHPAVEVDKMLDRLVPLHFKAIRIE